MNTVQFYDTWSMQGSSEGNSPIVYDAPGCMVKNELSIPGVLSVFEYLEKSL